jgi:ubiquinol-cytochrome c reductase cytochrome c subunit
MKNVHLFSAVAVIAGLCALTVPSQSIAAGAPSAERGYEIYMRVGCFMCHGTVGQGPVAGARLAPNPLPLEAMRAYIRAPAQVMPPYRENVLSDGDVADIHAYLESIPPAPNLEDTILAD